MSTSQAEERQERLNRILQSGSTKKIIVAGPGTGKTYTFGQLLKKERGGKNLAMTFIRGLVEDMTSNMGEFAEVRTFHSYCKKILHQQFGAVEMVPFLDLIVESDAISLGFTDYSDFPQRFQRLEVDTPETDFYLSRGDYYQAVSFDDAVYRVFAKTKDSPELLPHFDQIVIDEYQDFNALECAFISVLEQKGPILIVGDDDQAVHDARNASPESLRTLHRSGRYEVFELPFCGRCTEAVVESIKSFLSNAEAHGHLVGRIPRKFECFNSDKVEDNIKYPSLILGQIKVARTYIDYVKCVVDSLPKDDITASNKEGKEYPTVLVIGPSHYLKIIHDGIRNSYSQVEYNLPTRMEVDLSEGYNLLMYDFRSNLGWRILMECQLEHDEMNSVMKGTVSGERLLYLLPQEFVKENKAVLEILKVLSSGAEPKEKDTELLRQTLGEHYDAVISFFTPDRAEEDEKVLDRNQPTILLKSYVGSKGLSGGHVIIVGVNNGDIPKDSNNIQDVEIARLMVAITRTRKQCHIISNKWITPKSKTGAWNQAYVPSLFYDWLPGKRCKDLGLLDSKGVRSIDWLSLITTPPQKTD